MCTFKFFYCYVKFYKYARVQLPKERIKSKAEKVKFKMKLAYLHTYLIELIKWVLLKCGYIFVWNKLKYWNTLI